MQHYQPYESGSESESDSSGSYTTGTSESQREDHDARLSALDQWRAQGASWIAGGTRTAPRTEPGKPDTSRGVFNTEFKYVEERHISVLMLDSLDRDQTVYPSATSLRLRLPRTYKNIERIDIVQVKFLNALYAISAARRNNMLNWISDGSANSVTVPDGTYTAQQLIYTLGSTLANAGTTVMISYNCTAGRFVITDLSATTFELPWASTASTSTTEWGLGWNLGFGGVAVNLSGSLSYTASHMPRLFDDYVFLRLNEMEQMNDIDHTSPENTAMTQESTGQINDYFGKLLLNNFGCWSQTLIEMPKLFQPVLGRLDHMNVDWVDRHGEPLAGPDAATCDWHMTVRITELIERPAGRFDKAAVIGNGT